VRPWWGLAIASAIAVGCFGSLGGLSEPDGTKPDAGDDSAPPPPPPPVDPPPAPPPSDGGTDADGRAAIQVFADNFDDNMPLPRSWTEVVGAPVIESAADAPNKPNVLHATVAGDGGTPSFLRVKIATPGATSIACSFAVQLLQFSPGNYTTVAMLFGEQQTYVRLDLTTNAWHYYGQYPDGGDYANILARTMLGVWSRATLRLDSDGTVTVTVNDETLSSKIPPIGTNQLELRFGIQYALPPDTLDVRYDDVRCSVN
jgi:hypothetical protein